jgi:hypothetical protein
MIKLTIHLNAEGMLEGVSPEDVIHLRNTLEIGVLEGGMQSGKPSVAFAFTLPDGKKVFAETSLKLFQAAAKAFAAKYGWIGDEEIKNGYMC